MRAGHRQYPCDLGVGLRDVAGVRPPLLYEYPTPPSSVRLLFLGWNPPKPYGGFWSLDQPDNLRRDLHWILHSMGRVKARAPDSEFLTQFIQTGHYLRPRGPVTTATDAARAGRLKAEPFLLPMAAPFVTI